MLGDVIRSGVIRRVTAHLADVGTLVDSDVIDEHLGRVGEVGKVDFLEIVGLTKVDNLGVSGVRRRICQ